MIYQGKTIHCDWREPGIAEVVFDAPGSVNKLDRETLQALREVVDVLKGQPELRGVLFSSGKSGFIVGADVTEFPVLLAMPAETLDQWLREANGIFNAIEDLPVPTLAAVNGVAFGGGMELCLACDLRLAATDARLALPETKLGIIPGFGGTTRLPRLIGADNAIEWIAGGEPSNAQAALKVGAVDAVCAPEALRETALKMLHQAIDGRLDWQAHRRRKQGPLLLAPVEAKMAFETARAVIFGKAGKHYPAPFKAVDVIEQAAAMDRDEALDVERAGFLEVAHTPVAENLVTVFLNDQWVKKKARTMASAATAAQRIGVLGAGIMGGGIAYQAASKGIAVAMKDIREAALTHGMDEAARLFSKQIERGRIDVEGMARALARITPTLHDADVADASVVIEAVVENPKVKDSVLREIEAQLDEQAVLTSNTSTISIDYLARNLARPERFCGMHFFNPVYRMPLVEVIRGAKTSDETVAAVVALALALGKSPIVVNDCPGFYVNRVLFPYFRGFNLLLRDGADFRQVDRVMEGFGWPMGPAWLLDVVGLDTAYHAAAVMAQGFPDRMANDFESPLEALYKAERYGQKNNAGFYRYETDRKGKPKKVFDDTVEALLRPVCAEPKAFANEEIVERMMLPMIIEVVRCLEDGIVASPSEADMGLILGLGFPPFRGGALKYADSIGLAKLVERAENYAHLGKAYQPTARMRAMAKAGERFYPAASRKGGEA